MVLYNDEGVPITTHSMIKTMRMCAKQTQYKYADRLKSRVVTSRPLNLGKWMHFLLEAHYKGEDWKETHRALTEQYDNLFDDEKERVGNLPVDCYNLMLSYLWHYKNESWIIHEVEFMVETTWPDGGIYRGKIDLLIEDEYGLWIVDHKNHKRLPTGSFRLKDSQSALYVWAARRMKIPVRGFIWNYIRTEPPSVPRLLKSGKAFYKKMGDTTYVAYLREIKRLGFDPKDPLVASTLARLKAQRYEHGKVQTSEFFQRHILERDDAVLKRIAAEAYRTHKRIHTYPFNQRQTVERSVGRHCDFMCSYTRLCETELYGGITANIIKQDFKTVNPMEYYNDERNLGE